MSSLLASSPRRTLSCRALPPVRPTRRTPAPSEPFGLGVDVPVLERWTVPGSPFTFVLTEPATETYRYCLTTYVDGQPVAEYHYDGCYFRDHAHADADLMVAEHHEFHRQYEAERFERWMAEQDRLASLAPIVDEAYEAMRCFGDYSDLPRVDSDGFLYGLNREESRRVRHAVEQARDAHMRSPGADSRKIRAAGVQAGRDMLKVVLSDRPAFNLLPALCGGAPDDDEPTEPTWADRRWAVETSPTRDEHYEVVREGRRSYASPITDEDVQVATGAVG